MQSWRACFLGSLPAHGCQPPAVRASQNGAHLLGPVCLQSTPLPAEGSPAGDGVGDPRASCHLGEKEVECMFVGTLACHLVHLRLLVKVKSGPGKSGQHPHVTTAYLQEATQDRCDNLNDTQVSRHSQPALLATGTQALHGPCLTVPTVTTCPDWYTACLAQVTDCGDPTLSPLS